MHDARSRKAPLITLYGGKLTTYRGVAEEIVNKLMIYFVPQRPWTAGAKLPGGDLSGDTLAQFTERLQSDRPFLSDNVAARMAGAYGTRVERILGSARSFDDLGPHLGHGLTAGEVRYLMRHEWAETADDVLWRRSKLGLKFSAQQKQALGQFMTSAMGEIERV